MNKKQAVIVKDLTIKFGDFTAVNRISFSVSEGEIFGFLGANGAGKTTTIRMLCGLLEPTAGEATVAGYDYKDGADEIKRRVGYMSQRFTLYNDLTVDENIQFTASLRKIPDDIVRTREKELFDFIGFKESTHTLVEDFPSGIKQELSLVVALLHNPEIIFLDEPTAGVSPAARARFWELIRSLAKKGKTIFVTTHYMDEAEQCERIALMRTGEIIALGTPRELETQSFPDLLLEITPKPDASREWFESLKKNPAITSLQPYGLRYHAIIKDQDTVNRLQQEYASSFASHLITPSLEDVFIRLVEGGTK